MTTRVKIEITQEHNPVVVTFQSERHILRKNGESITAYVHSSSEVHVTEMTSAEQHEDALSWIDRK